MNIRDLFGIELPVIQAPMAGVQGSRLAIAVSNAGGLGSLPCAMLGIDDLRRELTVLRSGTSKPYNVNFFSHTPRPADPAQEARWRQTLAPYYDELGIDAARIASGPGRSPFTAQAADVLAEFKPAVVSFQFGLPAPELVSRVKSQGAKVVACATTVEEARWLEAHGADAIVAQGIEAGGHRGIFLTDDMRTQLGTFALVPQVVHAVGVPVIAAGGIADADGVRAALALGAAGVQVGTAYLLCPEATTSAVHRAALKSDRARDTALTNVFSGGPARGIRNRLMNDLGCLSALAPIFPHAAGAVAPLRAKAEAAGSGDFSPLWCGQNASGCREIPAAKLTRSLAGLQI